MNELKLPHIKESISNFLYDEEGNISRSKILAVGSMMIVMGVLLGTEASAAHRSHSSHRTHSSHRSGSHSSHSTHSTHSNHGSHTTHSNHSTHSTHNTHSTHSTHSNATTVTHSNSTNITAPKTFQSPYNIAVKESALLGTHAATTSSGGTKTVNNLDVTKIK